MSSSVSGPITPLANVLYNQDLAALVASLKLEGFPPGRVTLHPCDNRYTYETLTYTHDGVTTFVLEDASDGHIVNSRYTANGVGAHRALWQLQKAAVCSVTTATPMPTPMPTCNVWCVCVCVSFVDFTVVLVNSFLECLNACL